MKVLIPIFAFLLFAVSSQARTITVDDNIPADYNNIQEAINDSNDGDIIVVGPGTYTGDGNRDIDFNGKAITVRSIDPNDPNIVAATIIDCNGTEDDSHRVFYFYSGEDENSIIDGFTITGGYISGDIMAIFPPFDGGGIYCDWSSPTIRNCIIRGNSSWYDGGGIYCKGSNPTIRNCIISENTAGFDGGAIFISWGEGQSTSHITNCTIAENYAENNGGGIWTNDYVTIANSIITDNTSSGDGGGFYLTLAGQHIINSTITGNSASYSGGGVYAGGGWVGLIYEITNCILWANEASEGSEIALKSHDTPIPAELTVSYSNVEGGVDGVFVEEGCILNWEEGNIDADPMFVDAYNPELSERDYHLLDSSPCIEAGDPNRDYTGQVDMDGQRRVFADDVDMGADEFRPGIHNVTKDTYYLTIQKAIDAAHNSNTIIVEDGTYMGQGNRDIDFLGKAITLRSQNGSDNCIIDCEQLGIGFYFATGEGLDSVVDGFTVTNGFSQDVGGGILCESSSPTINNCVVSGNIADSAGGGISCWAGSPTISNCTITGNEALTETGGGIWCSASSNPMVSDSTISNNSPDGIWLEDSNAMIVGTVEVVSDSLTGNGTFHIEPNATLDMDDSSISCDIAGTGTVHVALGKELIIEDNAVIDLAHDTDPNANGQIVSEGLLRVKDDAGIVDANVYITRAHFENGATIFNSIINIGSGATYGQFTVADNVAVIGNDIYTDGDRYMDLDPVLFTGTIQGNRIYVTVTEGQNNTDAGLFELRAQDLFCHQMPCESTLVQLETVPDFNMSTWTLERLELLDGAKLTLMNQFDYQPPYDANGDDEVLYVKDLILREGAVLNTTFNRVFYQTLSTEPNAVTGDEPLLGYSLNDIDGDSETEFETRVVSNNVVGPYERIHVERVEDFDPDPNGVMRMSSIVDLDPASPTYQQVVSARAKILFDKCSAETILIRVEYLFETLDPNAELVVYLSDVPEIMDHNDPNYVEHHIEVGRVVAPIPPQPGSAGSGRFGTFKQSVRNDRLDLSSGTWVELELLETVGGTPLGPAGAPLQPMTSGGGSVFINNVSAEVHCEGICLDITWDNFVNEVDFLTVIGQCGFTAELLEDAWNSRDCLDGAFSRDGFVDPFDVVSWDWTLNSEGRKNLCEGIPLIGGVGSTSTTVGGFQGFGGPGLLAGLPSSLSDLLIMGKRRASDAPTKLTDRLYVFDSNYQYVGWSSPASDRCNIKLVQGPEGELYRINSEEGVLRLEDTNEVTIIPPGKINDINEPRYHTSATVYVGIQGEGEDAVGRPIFDVAFYDANYVYVVPVVVHPNTADPNTAYIAAAKLSLLDQGTPPYQVVKLYDDPNAFNPDAPDNPNLSGLREIEVDDNGNVYIINVHANNESDILWKYDPNGTIKRLYLGVPNSENYLPNPIGMHVSNITNMLYLASAQYNPADVNSTLIYGFSTESLIRERSITINDMHHVTSITEEPASGSLWVAGFNMKDTPQFPDPGEKPFYHPYLAKVPYNSNTVQAVCISDSNSAPGNDLAMPMSVVWTRTVKCSGADIDKDGDVTFADFAVFALAWLSELGDAKWNSDCNISIPAGNSIDRRDLAILAKHWLETGCL